MLMQNHFINEISGDSYWVRFVFRVPPSLSYGDSPVRLPAVHVTSPGASLNDELVHFQQSSASVFQRSNSDTIGRKTQTRLSLTNSPQERHRAICRAMCRTSWSHTGCQQTAVNDQHPTTPLTSSSDDGSTQGVGRTAVELLLEDSRSTIRSSLRADKSPYSGIQ